jgi:hypothetical protein
MSTIIDRQNETRRDRQTDLARAELLQLAHEQGVTAIASIEDLAGEAEMTADFDVDEFLSQVREDRDRPSARSVE